MKGVKANFPKINSSHLRRVCPLLVPLDSCGCSYDGLITACGRDFRLQILIPLNGRLSDAQLVGDIALMKYLRAKKDILQQRLKESKELASFLMELITILENEIQKEEFVYPVLMPAKYYSQLIEDLDTLGWDNLTYVDKSLNEVHVSVSDRNNRKHSLKIKFPQEYPDIAPTISADLPCQTEFHFSKTKGLMGVLLQYEKYLNMFQALWDELDQVDQEMWVLEPEQPLRSDVTRRIALGKGSSLTFTVNPSFPNVKPDYQLLGSDRVIGPLQENLSTSFDLWDERKSIVDNWKKILGIEIPTRSNSKKEDIQGECGICYNYKLEDNKIPDRTCEDLRCQQQFHATCLYEWLRVLPTGQRSFNTIYGECPYCSKPISCKAPD